MRLRELDLNPLRFVDAVPDIAKGFEGVYAIVEPQFPLRDLTVALQGSERCERDAGNAWLRSVIENFFRE